MGYVVIALRPITNTVTPYKTVDWSTEPSFRILKKKIKERITPDESRVLGNRGCITSITVPLGFSQGSTSDGHTGVDTRFNCGEV